MSAALTCSLQTENSSSREQVHKILIFKLEELYEMSSCNHKKIYDLCALILICSAVSMTDTTSVLVCKQTGQGIM